MPYVKETLLYDKGEIVNGSPHPGTPVNKTLISKFDNALFDHESKISTLMTQYSDLLNRVVVLEGGVVTPPEIEGYDVFVIAGQSNAVGWGTPKDAILDAPITNVMQYKRDGTVGEASFPLDHNDPDNTDHDKVGFALSFAKKYLENNTLGANRQILLIPCAVAGTGFHDGRWQVTGDLYEYMETKVLEVKNMVGKTNVFKGILWHQGENDIFQNTASTYKTQLKALITSIRTAIGSDVPFIMGEFSPPWFATMLSNGQPILDAIYQISNEIPYSYVVSSSGLTGDAITGDIHFSAESQRTFGQRYYDGYVTSLTRVPDTTAPTLTITPSNTFTSTQNVTMSTNETATIYYTLDGTTPTTSSTVYSSAITLSATTTLKAFARDTAGNSSAVQTITYTKVVTDTTAPTLTITPATTFSTSQSVTMSTNETATVYYTLDGSTPTNGSLVYSSTLTLNATTTLKAFAVDSVGNASTVQTVIYTKDSIAPTITASPNGGTFTSTQNVTLTSDETATIYYTVDGTTPTTSSTQYSSSISISTNTTLKFFGVDSSGNASTVQTVNFVIDVAPVITATPSGSFTSTKEITLTSNETATIYYTLDGTTPTTSSAVYSSPFTISETTTVKYFGVDSGGNASTVQTVTYTKLTVVTTNLVYKLGDPTYNLYNGATYSNNILSLVKANGSYMYINDSEAFNFGSGNFSIQLRIKLNDTSGATQLLYSQNGASPYGYSDTSVTAYVSGNVVYFRVCVGGTGYDLSSVTITNPGSYHDIVLLRNGSTLKVYVDGVNDSSKDLFISGSVNNSTYKMAIGRWGESTGENYFLSADIKSFLVYKKALTVAEMQQNATVFA
ncbi:MAG: hypothetical protein K0S34_84 [Bacillales bacterium]|jgi:hypothetical protein|nr:hypothetical protein [Bacillales bacterium]